MKRRFKLKLCALYFLVILTVSSVGGTLGFAIRDIDQIHPYLWLNIRSQGLMPQIEIHRTIHEIEVTELDGGSPVEERPFWPIDWCNPFG